MMMVLISSNFWFVVLFCVGSISDPIFRIIHNENSGMGAYTVTASMP